MILNHKNLLYAIANCGYITKNIATQHFNISHIKLQKLVNEGIINIKGNLILFGKVTTLYDLSTNMKYDLRKHGKAIYRTNTSQLEHDYCLLKAYSCLPIECQTSWLNESELKLIYGDITTTDAIFMYNKLKIAVEVFTSSYTSEKIQEKINFSEKYCDKIITFNTSKIKY